MRYPVLVASVCMVALATPAMNAAKAHRKTKSTTKTASASLDAPLSPRERAQQMLNRFSFGARPGDVEKIMSYGPDGADKWFARQLKPGSISDRECNRRLRDYPTLTMTPAQVLRTYPDRATINRILEGRLPYPSDPELAAVYEVQVYKDRLEHDAKKNLTLYEITDQQKAERKADAARIAGLLFAMPKSKRMAALLKMPVLDRINFATYVAGQQKYTLLADFTPKEREYFYVLSSRNADASYRALDELTQGTLLRDVLSERQLQAVMADFWFNHFNIYGPKGQDRWYLPSYVRDTIRHNALGKFPDLLMATATSPAMMIYLDNWTSIGPDSPINNPHGKKGKRGINENYGRELMELHTLSVNGGYTQADVISLASILTGWSIDHPEFGGPFVFDAKKHQPGDKLWLGQTIPSGEMDEGRAALKVLAYSPKTAHFISWLLAQRFLADDPPASVVNSMAATYMQTGGDIKAILTTLIKSPEFNSHRYFRNKVKTPVEFVASVFRSTATEPTNPASVVQSLNQMGEGLYRKIEPTGYYITADKWMNTTALIDRMNFAIKLTTNRYGGQKFDSGRLLALGLMSQPAGTTPQTLESITTASAAFEPQSSPKMMPVRAVRASQTTTKKHRGMGGDAISTAEDDMQNSQAEPATAASGAKTKATDNGAGLALSVLETSLIGGKVSSLTNHLILQQVDRSPKEGGPANAPDKLDMLTALVIGSPEFQQR